METIAINDRDIVTRVYRACVRPMQFRALNILEVYAMQRPRGDNTLCMQLAAATLNFIQGTPRQQTLNPEPYCRPRMHACFKKGFPHKQLASDLKLSLNL